MGSLLCLNLKRRREGSDGGSPRSRSILLHWARTDGTKIEATDLRVSKNTKTKEENGTAHTNFFGGQAGAGGEKLYPRRQLK